MRLFMHDPRLELTCIKCMHGFSELRQAVVYNKYKHRDGPICRLCQNNVK